MSALGRSCAGVGSAIVTIITVMAVAALGSGASANSQDNKTQTYDGTTVYVLELDDASTPTGNIITLTADASVSVTASSSEFESAATYTQSNSDFTVTLGELSYTQDNTTLNLGVDTDGTTAVTISVSAEDYAKVSEGSSFSATVTSTKEVERLGFKYFSLIIAILFFVFILITCLGIKEKSTVDMETAGIGDMFKALIQNDQAMAMVIAIVLVNSATYITSNLLIYFFKYDLAGTNWQGNYTLFNTFAGGIQIIAMMAFFPLLRKFFTTMKIFYICVFSAIGGYLILLVMAFSGTNTVYPFLVPGFFIMAAVGILNVLVTIFLANTVDYGELKNNRRDESVIFSMQTFVVKLASGLSAFIASICLTVFNISDSATTFEAVNGSLVAGLKSYVDGIVSNGATVVSNSSVIGLRFVMTFVPIIGLVIAVIVFAKKYILTEEKLAEIETELKAKRQ
ncbi:MAG: MFS transporter [Lachnospiraceae bacterium]|nr:MFS transporter [Lachnospiraceae bacterium]